MGRYLSYHENKFIKRYLESAVKPYSILDIACGIGYFTLPLHNKGFQIIGLDLNSEALSVLQQKSKDIPLSVANAEHLPFANGKFNCILAIQCFEFLDYSMFLQECNRVLSDNGLLIFDFLNQRSYKWLLKQIVGRTEYLQNPSADFSYLEVFESITRYGFVIDGVAGYNWQPFTRTSNSVFVGITALIEDVLQLERRYHISPKILVAARKKNSL
ncbi:MAG: hypothetical protein SCALA701_26140 [Candidatus Scalindua sp.]|nr:class I SAM-dependent methyltransferase [Planctomycetota bacterium]GJQ59813.1 MAG: hypothetical protein SCALA701_26140 [Candidatus Scalindua sp.]